MANMSFEDYLKGRSKYERQKSREKLFEQEQIWKQICNELDWEFIKCI